MSDAIHADEYATVWKLHAVHGVSVADIAFAYECSQTEIEDLLRAIEAMGNVASIFEAGPIESSWGFEIGHGGKRQHRPMSARQRIQDRMARQGKRDVVPDMIYMGLLRAHGGSARWIRDDS